MLHTKNGGKTTKRKIQNQRDRLNYKAYIGGNKKGKLVTNRSNHEVAE